MAEEKTFENKIKQHILSNNGWYIKYWGGAKYTKSGIPDILACINGYFVAIEVKASHGKIKHLQLRTIREIRKSNGLGIVLYPKAFDLFKQMCESLNRGMLSEATDCQYEIDDTLKLTEDERRIFYGETKSTGR